VQDGLQSYSELLKESYAVIKAEDPSAVVHTGGLSQELPKCLRRLYDQGAGRFFDVLNIHPFINPLMPDAAGGLRFFYERVRRTLEAYGDASKPIWFSCIGCPGMKDPAAARPWGLGKNPSELVQAEWVRTVYGVISQGWPGVEKIFWGTFRDTDGHFKTGLDYAGLLRNDFSRKPAYEVYRRMASSAAALTLPSGRTNRS